MRARVYFWLLVCLVIRGVADASGQSLIRLDIHATRDGQPVLDLAPTDIDVSEGTVPQRIDELKHVATAARAFIVFLDTPHLRFEGVRQIRNPLAAFLDRLLDDDDLVALITPDAVPDRLAFETKQAVISDVVQDEAAWERTRAGSRDAKEDRYAQCYPANQYRGLASDMQERHREAVALDALERLTSRLSMREERTAIILVSEGWKLPGPDARMGQGDASGRNGRGGFPPGGRGRPGGAGADTGARSIDEASSVECDADRVSLAAADNARRLDRLADAANRSMASFYAVYAPILVPPPTAGAAARPAGATDNDPAARVDSLRQLSANTNGLAVTSSTGLEMASTRISLDMNAYDVIAYRSSNTSLDGRFRAVTVRSLRPGVVVRARRGYRGASAEDVMSTRSEPTAAAAAISASASQNARGALRVRTATARTGDGSDATLWVVGELDYRARRELAWTAGAVADVTVIAADGRDVASRTIELTAAEVFQVKLSDGGGLAPGEYAVRVRLRPNNDGGLPVTDTTRVVVPTVVPTTGEGLLWRRGPSTGPRYVLTADSRFLRSERIRVELPTRTSAPATARMLDRQGKPNQVPVQASERVDEDGLRWVVADATLAALAPGDYAIEITVDGATRVTAFQLVP